MNRSAVRPLRSMIRSALVLIMVGPLLVGCVSIPTSGQAEQVPQTGQVSQNRSEVVPKPPLVNAAPRLIIEGFLLAMTRYEPNYAVARQFLSSNRRESWRPEDKVTIFTNRKLISTNTTATLNATRTGVLGPDGAYTAGSGTVVQNFEMVKEKGQWRIGNPPNGLLISEDSFTSSFRPFDLYFYDPTFTALVPDPIYLPAEGRIEASLVQALLNGPSSWLKPAVTTAFPPKTSLNTNSVPVVNGLAQIALSDPVLALNEDQRTNLVTQLSWTLRQDEGIRGLQITVNSAPFSTRDQVIEENQTFVPITTGDQKGPIAPQTSTDLVGLSGRNVVTVDDTDLATTLRPVPGPFGRGAFAIDSLAISNSAQGLAAVTDGRTILRRGPFANATPTVLIRDVAGLLRPQFTRYDELWDLGSQGGRQVLFMIKGSAVVATQPSWLSQMSVTAFQISPDGSRMAVLARQGSRDVLGMATITRGERLSIGAFRAIQLSDAALEPLTQLVDLGWIAPTQVMVLASTGSGAAVEPYGVEQDGSQVTRIGSSGEWQATSLTTAVDPSGTGVASGGGFRAVVAGQGSQTWQYRNGDVWPTFSAKLRIPAYPG